MVEVIARSVAFDVVDGRGRPVAELPPGIVRVFEDGVERSILAIERRATVRATATIAAPTAIVPASARGPIAEPSVVGSHVLVALDPTTLGRRDWREATDRLSEAADALVALGPVDVVALTAPPRAFVVATRDAGAVRAALAASADEARPQDGFYAQRLRFLREAQAMMSGGPSMPMKQTPPEGEGASDAPIRGGHDPAAHRAMLVRWLRAETLQLAADEERQLRLALERLQAAMATVPRPTVAVWVAGGEPLAGEFVRGLLPPGEGNEEQMLITEVARWSGFWSELDGVWRSWEEAGVRVVAWGPARVDEVDLGTADARRPVTSQRDQRFKLSADPLVLLAAAATTTGGALVQDPAHLAELLDSVAGRWVVTYQSDSPAAGWRELRVVIEREGWAARYPSRVLVPQPAAARPDPGPVAVVLAVQLGAERYPSEQPGRELVKLPVIVDLAPLRTALAPGAPARFVFRIFATPPGAETLVRDIEVKLGAVPEIGNLRYEPSGVVPRGTAAFAVEVRETESGALGVAGPVDAVGDGGDEDAKARAAAVEVAAGGFTESTEVRISEARFLVPKGSEGAPAGVRVVWKGHEQKLVRVAGGAGSSLELGIAFDVSESAVPERTAFAQAAVAAASRLLGEGDRLFRVDFGNVPRFLGATRSGAGELLTTLPIGVPEKTAIFDALRFSLDRFAAQSDRSALVVFTDGCETAGRTGWEEVERAARAKAIPIFVVMADAEGCAGLPDIVIPDSTVIGSVATSRSRKGQTVANSRPVPVTGGSAAAALRSGERAETSRQHLRKVAYGSGGLLVPMRKAERAEAVWSEVEAALARLWVAVFEPTAPEVDGRQVEVRTSEGRLLRPSG